MCAMPSRGDVVQVELVDTAGESMASPAVVIDWDHPLITIEVPIDAYEGRVRSAVILEKSGSEALQHRGSPVRGSDVDESFNHVMLIRVESSVPAKDLRESRRIHVRGSEFKLTLDRKDATLIEIGPAGLSARVKTKVAKGTATHVAISGPAGSASGAATCAYCRNARDGEFRVGFSVKANQAGLQAFLAQSIAMIQKERLAAIADVRARVRDQ
jgi:hypothetical protein